MAHILCNTGRCTQREVVNVAERDIETGLGLECIILHADIAFIFDTLTESKVSVCIATDEVNLGRGMAMLRRATEEDMRVGNDIITEDMAMHK